MDKSYYDTLEWKEVDDIEYNTFETESGYIIKNGKYINNKSDITIDDVKSGKYTFYVKESDKYYKPYILGHCSQTHIEITKHKILYKIYNYIRNLYNFFSYKIPQKQSKKNYIKSIAFKNKVAKRVLDCEKACEEHCENCGEYLDNKNPNRSSTECHMYGWTTYLCKRCAVASGRKYRNIVNNKTYIGVNEVCENEQ